MTVFHLVASYAASLLDFAAAGSCAILSIGPRKTASKAPFGKVWLFAAVAFAGFGVLGLSGLETALQDALRNQLLLDGDYAVRREFQTPATVVALLAIAASFGLVFWRLHSEPQQQRFAPHRVAILAVMAIAGVSVLRLISLHAVDALLYGPLKLNWAVELGAPVFAIAASLKGLQRRRRAEAAMRGKTRR